MKKEVNIEQKIKDLTEELNKYSRAYYVDSKPLVEDSYYDQKMRELQKLEEEYPQFLQPNSPSNKIGFEVVSSLEKKQHQIKMLSLQNALNQEELKDFLIRIAKSVESPEEIEYVLEPKIDGVSISLIYKDGKLVDAITRGDGTIGESVIHNVKLMNRVPKTISYTKNLIVRGEIFSNLSNFKRINKLNYNKYANPRNFASGTIRLLDSKEFLRRNLNIFVYQAYFLDEPNKIDYHSEIYDFFEENHFNFFHDYKVANSLNNFTEEIQFYDEARKKLDFEMDGIAIKIDDIDLQKELGSTIKFPKWAIAYKFAPEIGYTKLLDIFTTVGRTGLIVYNAKLEPINLLNTIVQYATLHNLEYIKDLDLRVNDFVYIKKSGEIIPKLIKPDLDARANIKTKKWSELTHCPECNSELVFSKTKNNQFCINKNCPGIIKAKLIHYASKQGMDYASLGEKNIIRLFNLKLLNSIEDFYKLKDKKDELLKLEGFKEKSVNKILNSIESSKQLSLERLIYALGINNIGFKSALDLANNFSNLKEINNQTFEQLSNLKDFGEIKAKSLIDYFNSEDNKELIVFLELNKQNFTSKKQIIEEEIDETGIFYQKNIVVTGTFEDVSRLEAEEILMSKGAYVKKTVSSKTDYLIVGLKPSQSKLDKIDQSKILEVLNFNDLLGDLL